MAAPLSCSAIVTGLLGLLYTFAVRRSAISLPIEWTESLLGQGVHAIANDDPALASALGGSLLSLARENFADGRYGRLSPA
jgi:hypothetical protein